MIMSSFDSVPKGPFFIVGFYSIRFIQIEIIPTINHDYPRSYIVFGFSTFDFLS